MNGSTSSALNYRENIVPVWIIGFYFVIISLGACLNLLHIYLLFQCRRNGPLSLILQIVLIDLISVYVSIIEILALNSDTFFSSISCPLYKGTEIFVNTLVVYLLICFNFHVISLWNLHQLEVRKSKRNPLTSSCNSKDDSSECLVTKQENRAVTIDYRKRKYDISIVFPTIFLWFLSCSLSVPNYTLSSTLEINEKQIICALIDVYYGSVLQYLLVVFKVFVPTILLIISFLLVLSKLKKTAEEDLDNLLMKKALEIRTFLTFAALATMLYFLTSFQRQLFHFLHIVFYNFKDSNINNFRIPPIFNNYLSDTALTYLAMLHYLAGPLRGLLYFGSIPKFRYLLRTKVFICYKINT